MQDQPSELEERIMAQEARLDAQAVLIHGLTSRLSQMDATLLDKSRRIHLLKKRICILEQRFKTRDVNIRSLRSDLVAIEEGLSEVEGHLKLNTD